MNRFITAFVVAICSLAAGAQSADVTTRLDSLYNAVLTAPEAVVCKVRFTGSDARKAPGGFIWQRGSGKGWTQGRRITLTGVPAAEVAVFDGFFKEIAKENFVIRYSDHCSATLIESTGTIYIYDYDDAGSRLSFMKAVTAGEICVPKAWTSVDSIDATLYDPLAFASKRELAQLGLSRLWAEVRRNFAFMDRTTLNWDSLYVANMAPVAEAAEAGDDERVGKLLQLMAARLGNGDHILRHLTTDSIMTDPWTSPAYIPAYASWRMKQPVHKAEGGTMQPYTDRPIYERPVTVLVDAGTFSAAEDFTAIFRDMGRGKVVGTRTAGSTGNGVGITLIPGVAYANICSKHDIAPDGTEFVGIGIVPDIEVAESYDSYFGKADSPVIRAALSALSSSGL